VKRRFKAPEETGIFVVLVTVAAVMAILSPTFATVDNLLVVLLTGSVIAFWPWDRPSSC
jgi:ribose/xylose/arabinose/galactoside ABC-type transport system permease subunit